MTKERETIFAACPFPGLRRTKKASSWEETFFVISELISVHLKNTSFLITRVLF